ncbi:MAG: hypothetical protein K2Y20_05005 [Sphingomonas sp.]|nr:hypothetical protein [Sphingomonas sp.]
MTGAALAVALAISPIRGTALAETGPASELVVRPGEAVAATIEGKPVELRIVSAGPDRLLINAATADRLGLKPAMFVGRASLNVAGRREFEGRNRPVDFGVGGVAQKGRALWFPAAPPVPGDGTIGPWGLKQSRVTLVFGADDPSAQRSDFPLFGSASNGSVTGYREESFGLYAAFDLDDSSEYPVASAAAGAAIAKVYGGQLSGPSWDVELLFGIKRPVRLMTLERPFKFGPLSFTKIAVRVRDRIDAAGRGENIKDADQIEDPSEVIVTASAKGRPPIFGLTIPRASMTACSKLSFDKGAKRIELWCRPA